MIVPILSDDEWSYALHMQGYASTLGVDEPNEAVRLLRQCVKDVTGLDVVDPPKPRIGFLP